MSAGIKYYSTQETAISGDTNNLIAFDENGYTVGGVVSTSVNSAILDTYIINWRITNNSSGDSLKSLMYTTTTPDVLLGTYTDNSDSQNPVTSDASYRMYPDPVIPYGIKVYYYSNKVDAETSTNSTNSIGSSGLIINRPGRYGNWKIANRSTGTSSKFQVYKVNDVLTFTPTGIYYLYPVPPCFLEGTKILCQIDGVEQYTPIEDMKEGVLVKTCLNGYKKVFAIVKGVIENPGNSERTENRLYKCSTTQYKELTEDLFLTGCHSILEFPITDKQKEDTIKILGKMYVTDKKYRLMACVDERAEPWNSEGSYTIYHFALEDKDDGINFGVYANGGLLVETCAIRTLLKQTNMTRV